MNGPLVKLAGLVVVALLGLFGVAEIEAEHDRTHTIARAPKSPEPGIDAGARPTAGSEGLSAGVGLPPARAVSPHRAEMDEGFETEVLPLGGFVVIEELLDLLEQRFPELDPRDLRQTIGSDAVSVVLPWSGEDLVFASPGRRLGCRRHETLVSVPPWAVMDISMTSAGTVYLSEGVMVSTCQLRRGKRLSRAQRARWARKFTAGFLRANPGFRVVRRSSRWFGAAHAPVLLIDGQNPLLGEPERNALVFLTTPDLLVVLTFVAPLADFTRMEALVEPVVTSLMDLR